MKQISIVLIMAGVLLIILPSFIGNPVLKTIGKPAGYGFIFLGVIMLIAGKQIVDMFRKMFDKQYKDMTPEQIIGLKRKEHELAIQQQKDMLELEKQKLEIAITKAKIQKLKGSGSGGSDILGNISGLITGDSKKPKKDPLKEIQRLF